MVYELEIEMTPVAKQRPRVTRGGRHTYTPKKTLDAEARIKQEYLLKYGKTMLDCPLKMSVTSLYSVPKSYAKWEKELVKAGVYHKVTSPDVDNLAKTVLDALNKIAYEDDKYVVSLETSKGYSKDDRNLIRIKITELEQGCREGKWLR